MECVFSASRLISNNFNPMLFTRQVIHSLGYNFVLQPFHSIPDRDITHTEEGNRDLLHLTFKIYVFPSLKYLLITCILF